MQEGLQRAKNKQGYFSMTLSAQTPRRLESFVSGHWTAGQRDGKPLLNAATGQTVALIDASGLDYGAALDWGRKVGGRNLRKYSFHERAAMLKALAQALMDQKEEFYAESFLTGATRTDGWIDIEGGIGTLFAYSSKARRELPNTSRIMRSSQLR